MKSQISALPPLNVALRIVLLVDLFHALPFLSRTPPLPTRLVYPFQLSILLPLSTQYPFSFSFFIVNFLLILQTFNSYSTHRSQAIAFGITNWSLDRTTIISFRWKMTCPTRFAQTQRWFACFSPLLPLTLPATRPQLHTRLSVDYLRSRAPTQDQTREWRKPLTMKRDVTHIEVRRGLLSPSPSSSPSPPSPSAQGFSIQR